MEWIELYEKFSDMPHAEKVKLFDAIKETLYPEPKSNLITMVDGIREVRFRNGLACIHCGSLSLKRNGKYRSRQRYLCKDCGKTFNDISGSPLSGTHYPHKWLQYFEMMVEGKGKSLPKIALDLEIHVSTAFYWRHKILNAIHSISHQQLRGIVESDETYILESEKAKRVELRTVNHENVVVLQKNAVLATNKCVL